MRTLNSPPPSLSPQRLSLVDVKKRNGAEEEDVVTTRSLVGGEMGQHSFQASLEDGGGQNDHSGDDCSGDKDCLRASSFQEDGEKAGQGQQGGKQHGNVNIRASLLHEVSE